jgi:NifU-like protein involved in Fe-S cluster formation
MNVPLYTAEILRWAACLPEPVPLDRVDKAGEARSETCGSRVRAEVHLDSSGRVEALSQKVEACAFGQAAASILASKAIGCTPEELETALRDLSGWLAGERSDPGVWRELAVFEPARRRHSRHGAILAPLRALITALRA